MSYDESTESAPGRLIVGGGPRDVEQIVLEVIERDRAQLRADPLRLGRPLRVVVPSRSLREHLAARLVEHDRGAVAGVAIQTLYGLALDVLESGNESVRVASLLLPVLGREAAHAEPALRARLADLVDGYAVVRAAVDDLLDAGFEGHHAEAVEERIAELASRGASREIAGAIVRVALRVNEGLEAKGYAHRSAVMRRAQELLETDPERLASRGIIVHGFSDATGVATELLCTLLRRPGSLAVLDCQPEPGGDENTVAVDAFSMRFHDRLASSHVEEGLAPRRAPSPRLHGIEASGGEAEVREVGVRIQGLLHEGVRPEAIGVVARDLSSYALAIRAHFDSLAIPFSGMGQGVAVDPSLHRVAALMDLLRSAGECLADRWLDVVRIRGDGDDEPVSLGAGADLRLALRCLGATRLEHVAALGPQTKDLRLPFPSGIDPADVPEIGAAPRRDPRSANRTFSGRALAHASEAARSVLDELKEWPRRETVSAHAKNLEAFVFGSLGWDTLEATAQSWFEVVRDALGSVPADFVIERDDFVGILDRVSKAAGEIPLGGRGGGVQVLTVMEARARTFSHLFVLGLNRDVFPRPVREDPILGDDIRRAMGELLPDMPVKRRGHDEDRHLFGQLVAAAPEVTLSWQSVSDDGKAASRSTFIERLLWQGEGLSIERVGTGLALPTPRRKKAPLLRPVFEEALEASLEPGQATLRHALSVAIEEGWTRAELPVPAPPASEALADARLSTVAELDRSFGAPDLGPFFGFVGHAVSPGDRRLEPSWVTALEAMARCPWQAFLSRVLRVESVPDRVAEIPDLENHVLGNVVHGTLERIVREAVARDESEREAVARDPVDVPWPSPEHVDRVLLQAANAALTRAGLRFSGLAPVAVERARPFAAVARERDWVEAGEGLAAEFVGEVARYAGGPERGRIFFAADRVDLRDGDLLLSDYKTGKPLSGAAADEAEEREDLLDAVRAGKMLQAAAYALVREREGDAGRYLFLRPDVSPEAATVTVKGTDAEVIEAFEETVSRLLGLRAEGVFVPRLISPKGGGEADVCRSCDLAQACLRGDSGARGRLGRWFEAGSGDADEVGARAALRHVFDPEGRGRWTAGGSRSRSGGKA